MPVLKQSFFDRDTLSVARELIGQKLVRKFNDVILSGMIVEVEAYIGRDDSACHASKGKTFRNIVMFGPANLCRAMAIDKTLNGWDVTRGEKLWLEAYQTYPYESICRGPRIGINYAKLKDRQSPWRFWLNT
jgi:DNA-3-methyladenine glycosylase